MADEHVSVKYDGPEVADHRMDVQDLAPALLSFASMVKAANRALYPGEPEPSVHIKAASEGSFAIDLAVTEGFFDRAIAMLTSSELDAVLNLGAVLGGVWGAIEGARWLIRKIRGTTNNPDGTVTFTDLQGNTITLSPQALILIRDPEFRRSLRRFMQPLEREGIESVSLDRGNDTPPVVVTRNELTAFDLPPSVQEDLGTTTRTVALRLATVAFNEGNKWRVSDGESTYYAVVADTAFVDRVVGGSEQFAANDILRCEVTTRQWQTVNGELKTEHTIDRVLDHISGSRQLPLPFEIEPQSPAGPPQVIPPTTEPPRRRPPGIEL